MEHFPVYMLDSAPDTSKPALRDVQARFGMIPNLAGAMATSHIQSFIGIFDKVHGGNFTEPQIQTVLLTDAVTNACTWAVALHTALALQAGVDPADTEAMRAGRSPSDSELGALSTLARTPTAPSVSPRNCAATMLRRRSNSIWRMRRNRPSIVVHVRRPLLQFYNRHGSPFRASQSGERRPRGA
jgi:AhpD family alkylhydroperoxidase